MNTPMYQQMVLNAQNQGQDKRAVGSRNDVLNQAVRSEGERLFNLDVTGDQLATRRDKLGFARQIASKQHALAQTKMKERQRQSDLAFKLGMASSVATGFGAYNQWNKDRRSNRRDDELYAMYFNALPRQQRIK